MVDPDDHALYISLGCALENLIIAALWKGLKAEVEYRNEHLRVTLAANGSDGAEPLFRAISLRQTNRRMYDGQPIPENQIARLHAANVYESVDIRTFRTTGEEIEPIIDLVREGNIAQFNDEGFVQELLSWIRFSGKEARARRDGLTARALGFPPIPRWLGRFMMTRLAKPESEAAKQERAIRSSALVMVFVARNNDSRHWIDLGRSFERVALTATSLGIAHAHVNMPCEVEPRRARLAAHLGLTHGEQPLLLIRFGYAKPLPRSPRRSLEDVVMPA